MTIIKMEKITVFVPVKMKENLQEIKEENNESVGVFVRRAIAKELKRIKKD